MQQLNAYRFYELGAKLHSLFCGGNQGRVADLFAPMTEAQTMLDSLIKGDVLVLEMSKSEATKLLNKIASVFNRYYIDPSTKQLRTPEGEDRIDAHELSTIHNLIEKFEHALAAELNRAPTYAAGKRGIYSTFDLAENAQQILSDNVRANVPSSVLTEMNAAGRALAFGLSTAASVHLLRCIEIMLRPYYEAFNGKDAAKGERNYSVYLKKLATMADEDEKTDRPDRRVVQMLAQIKDHYRNPLVTPDQVLSIDEATQLLGLTSALVSLMSEQIANRKRSTEKPEAKAITAMSHDEDEDETFDLRMSQAG
jgi:hypothetical protein